MVNGEVFTHVPHSRDASPHGRDTLSRAYARIRDWLLEIGKYWRKGIKKLLQFDAKALMALEGGAQSFTF